MKKKIYDIKFNDNSSITVKYLLPSGKEKQVVTIGQLLKELICQLDSNKCEVVEIKGEENE